MYILGVIYSLNSTVCLLRDGEILSAVSEEKFSRVKNDDSFPAKALSWVLAEAGITIKDVDHIALSTKAYQGMDEYQLLKKFSTFKIEDYVKEQTHYWKPKIMDKAEVRYAEVFKSKIDTEQFDPSFWKEYAKNGPNGDYRVELLKRFFGDKTPPIETIDHHRAHAAYGYYASPFRGKDCMVMTIDAFGDGLNATVSKVSGGRIERVFATNKFTLARLYKFMTLYLGMKPNEHEYKVMGLAPYAKEPIAAKPYKIFRETLQVDGLDFKYNVQPTDNYYYFKEKLEGCRFDGIAAGLQRYVEEVLVEWTRNIVAKYGIRRVVFSGGVAMNVKALGKIAEMPEVDEIFVCGCGSDESTAIGAAYASYEDTMAKTNGSKSPEQHMRSMETLYKGPDIQKLDDKAVQKLIAGKPGRYKVVKDPSLKEVATHLSQEKVIARCVGRTEFGARALGNRSILADPRNPAIVAVINEKIKNRDFWMPFAPIVLDSASERYLINPKKLPAPFMTVAFETTPLGQKHLPAALHPADKSARPQILTRQANPSLHELISEFEKLTGVGGLINTSFNLHGHPIVNTPEDAMFVMDNSELDGLLLPGYLILRA